MSTMPHPEILAPARPSRVMAIALMALVSVISGCDSDEEADPTPTPIPSPAFSIQTDLFEDPPGDPGDNFQAAASRILPVADPVNAHMDIPRQVSSAVRSMPPTEDGDGWRWTTDVMGSEESLKADLKSVASGQNIFEWSLTLTGADGEMEYEEFDVLNARAVASGRLGAWDRYHLVNGERLRSLASQFGVEDFQSYLAITVTDSLSPVVAPGDSLDYVQLPGDLERFYWVDRSAEEAFLIEWNSSTMVGGIRASDYNDAQASCWDSDLADAPC